MALHWLSNQYDNAEKTNTFLQQMKCCLAQRLLFLSDRVDCGVVKDEEWETLFSLQSKLNAIISQLDRVGEYYVYSFCLTGEDEDSSVLLRFNGEDIGEITVDSTTTYLQAAAQVESQIRRFFEVIEPRCGTPPLYKVSRKGLCLTVELHPYYVEYKSKEWGNNMCDWGFSSVQLHDSTPSDELGIDVLIQGVVCGSEPLRVSTNCLTLEQLQGYVLDLQNACFYDCDVSNTPPENYVYIAESDCGCGKGCGCGCTDLPPDDVALTIQSCLAYSLPRTQQYSTEFNVATNEVPYDGSVFGTSASYYVILYGPSGYSSANITSASFVAGSGVDNVDIEVQVNQFIEEPPSSGPGEYLLEYTLRESDNFGDNTVGQITIEFDDGCSVSFPQEVRFLVPPT